MKPEKQLLLHDLLDDGQDAARREATLLAGGRVLRHKRWRRMTTRSLAVAAVLGAAVMSLHLGIRQPRPAKISAPVTPPAVSHLTDDQLLALFPNTPVGLATIGDRKTLIFPRPADRARFVGKF